MAKDISVVCCHRYWLSWVQHFTYDAIIFIILATKLSFHTTFKLKEAKRGQKLKITASLNLCSHMADLKMLKKDLFFVLWLQEFCFHDSVVSLTRASSSFNLLRHCKWSFRFGIRIVQFLFFLSFSIQSEKFTACKALTFVLFSGTIYGLWKSKRNNWAAKRFSKDDNLKSDLEFVN